MHFYLKFYFYIPDKNMLIKEEIKGIIKALAVHLILYVAIATKRIRLRCQS